MTYIRYILKNNTITTVPTRPRVPSLPPAVFPTSTGMKTASGQMLQRGILGQNLQRAIRRQGLPANTNRVRYTGSGNDITVYPY